jgi:hypothetical protein
MGYGGVSASARFCAAPAARVVCSMLKVVWGEDSWQRPRMQSLDWQMFWRSPIRISTSSHPGGELELQPGERLEVFTGQGTSNAGRYFAGGSTELWSNLGDTVSLRSPSGSVIASLAY